VGSVGGPRHYRGAGLGQIGAWTCPTCGTEHVTPLEAGCPVCLAEDARRAKSVVTTVKGVAALAPYLLLHPESPSASLMIRGAAMTEAAKQSVAAALAHFVEHGLPDDTLLSPAVMIGWARELAGLE